MAVNFQNGEVRQCFGVSVCAGDDMPKPQKSFQSALRLPFQCCIARERTQDSANG